MLLWRRGIVPCELARDKGNPAHARRSVVHQGNRRDRLGHRTPTPAVLSTAARADARTFSVRKSRCNRRPSQKRRPSGCFATQPNGAAYWVLIENFVHVSHFHNKKKRLRIILYIYIFFLLSCDYVTGRKLCSYPFVRRKASPRRG